MDVHRLLKSALSFPEEENTLILSTFTFLLDFIDDKRP